MHSNLRSLLRTAQAMRASLLASDRQHIVVQTFFGSLDPGLEPIAVPMLWPEPDQYDPGCLHEQRAQIAIAAPGYLAEDGTVSRRYLLWHQSEPGAEVAAFGECSAVADRGDRRTRDDRPDAGHRHQPVACRVPTGQRSDLAGQDFDALIEPVPIVSQSLAEVQHAWRQDVCAFGKYAGQFDAQEAQHLAHRNAALQQEGANLIDDAGALADLLHVPAVKGLQGELNAGLGVTVV